MKRFLLISGSLIVLAGVGIYLEKHNNSTPSTNEKGAMLASSASAIPITSCSFETGEQPVHSRVVINEIAWMGSKDSANNEWLELKNILPETVDIHGWRLIDRSEKIKITLGSSASITSGGLYLLGRGQGNVADAKVDVVYKGALRNGGESLRLFDRGCHLIDEVLADAGWPAGNNTGKYTMERDSKTFTWHTSKVPGGTPKQENTHPIAKIAVIQMSKPNTTPSPTIPSGTITCETWCTSSYNSSKYYYCKNDSAWKTLSLNYFKSFPTKEALLTEYPSRILHDASLCK